MKKFCILFILALCLSMTACFQTGDSGNNTTGPAIDIHGEPEIIPDKNDVQQENRYDEMGNHVGYYRYTNGTNCGIYGCMLIEFTDLDGNVSNSYAPKFAGSVLASGQFGSFAHGQYELTNIWESDYNAEAVNSNSYIIVPYSGGTPYVYIEDRNGATVRCDLYGEDGTVVASLTPDDPQRQLEVDYYEANCVRVCETFTEERSNGSWIYSSRDLTYDREGNLLCEIVNTHTEYAQEDHLVVCHSEVKNASGEVVRSYEQPALDYELSVYYDPESGAVIANASKIDYETMSVIIPFEECFDPVEGEVLYREENIYENGQRVETEWTVFGGKLVVTGAKGFFSKLEFYGADGALNKTMEAADGEILSFGWDRNEMCLRVYVCDKEGNEIRCDTYDQP